MIQVLRLVQEKYVCETEEKSSNGKTIKDAQGHHRRQQKENGKMPIKPVSRPRRDPLKTVKLEQKLRLEIVCVDPAMEKIPAELDEHEHAEGNAECCEQGSIHGLPNGG